MIAVEESPGVTGSVDTDVTCGKLAPGGVDQVRYSDRCEACDVICVTCPEEE